MSLKIKFGGLWKENLNPMNNRKSRYHFICYEYWIVLLFAVRFSYIVIGGHVAGTSLAEKQTVVPRK